MKRKKRSLWVETGNRHKLGEHAGHLGFNGQNAGSGEGQATRADEFQSALRDSSTKIRISQVQKTLSLSLQFLAVWCPSQSQE